MTTAVLTESKKTTHTTDVEDGPSKKMKKCDLKEVSFLDANFSFFYYTLFANLTFFSRLKLL